LRVANVRDDRIDFTVLKEMPYSDEEAEAYRLRPGDILVSEGQSVERIGQSAVYRGEEAPLCFQSTLHRFRPYDASPSSEYCQMVFRSHVRSGVFRQHASITTNIAHLVLRSFRVVPFPLPPPAEAERIVETASRILSVLDAVDAERQRLVGRCEKLRQSVFKWAFQGKLVDQDPNDEPASALLERIRAEREAGAPVRRPRQPHTRKSA
jgi:type I restriction enzyme S subunit